MAGLPRPRGRPGSAGADGRTRCCRRRIGPGPAGADCRTGQLERWVGIAPTSCCSPPKRRAVRGRLRRGHPVGAGAAAATSRLRGAQAAVTASERSPNWTWGVSYGQRTGYSDMVSFGVSIPIPLSPVSGQDRETAAKLALADKAEADLAEATRAATAEYRMLISDSRAPAGPHRSLSRRSARARNQRRGRPGCLRLEPGESRRPLRGRHAVVDAQRKVLSFQRELAKVKLSCA